MRLQALLLSIALLFGAAAYAQDKPKEVSAPIDILNAASEPVGQAFAAELEAKFKALDGIVVVEGTANKTDSTRPEVRILSKKIDDTRSVVLTIVTVHVQGKNVSFYIATLGQFMTAAQAKDEADAAIQEIGESLAGVEPYLEEDAQPAPAQKQSAPQVAPDNTEKS